MGIWFLFGRSWFSSRPGRHGNAGGAPERSGGNANIGSLSISARAGLLVTLTFSLGVQLKKLEHEHHKAVF